MQLLTKAACDENQSGELGTGTVLPAWGSAALHTPRSLGMGGHRTPSDIRKVSSVQSLSHPCSQSAIGPSSSSFCLHTCIPSHLHTPTPPPTPPHTHKRVHGSKRSPYGFLPGALQALDLAAPQIRCFFPSPASSGQDRAPWGVRQTGHCTRSPGREARRA